MLTRELDREKRLYEVLREAFTRDTRDGVHLTDLLNPRQTYWRQLDPQPITDAEIGFFSGGRGHEDAVGKLLVKDFS